MATKRKTRVASGGKVGPNILELEKVAKQSRRLETFAVMDMKDDPVVMQMQLSSRRNGQWMSTSSGTPEMGYGYEGPATSFSAAMLDVTRRWTNGTLKLTSITAKSIKGPLDGKQLQRLAVAAWCEACGVPVPSKTEIEEQFQAVKADQDKLREEMLQELYGAPEGIKRWNDRRGKNVPMYCLYTDAARKAGHFRHIDLSNLDLSGVNFNGLDFRGAVFDGSSLVRANLEYGDFRKASFRNAILTNARCSIAKFSGTDFPGASLYQTHLRGCTFASAVFDGADLSEAHLHYADLRGADLSGANISGAKFEYSKYNKETRMPPGFKHIDGMKWKSDGPPPGITPAAPAPAAGAIDFNTLMKRLPQTVSGASLSKALQMLKADRFQLFAEVKEDVLVGVVKSQSDPDLVYSCRLASDGAFACCTQNLRPCGGLHGKLCKHLLVLLVGLAKAGQLDPATAESWAQASRTQRPILDKDTMSETFLRYKGAEAGEIDWRPIETIPEDYYAL